MKKLLSIFSSFGVIMSSSLSSIACKNNKTNDQPIIDKAVEQLKNQTINITVTDGKENTVKTAIKENSDFKAKLADSKIKIESFAFKKDGAAFQGSFVNDQEYEVTVKLKLEDSKQDLILEGTAIFKIKITISTGQQKVSSVTVNSVTSVVEKLKAINEEVIELESTDLDVAKLTTAIQNLQAYKDVFKDNVTLEGNLTLKKAGAIVTTVADNDVISVTGKVKTVTDTETKVENFEFTIKVDVLTNQEKVDKAEVLLQAIDKQIIKLASGELTVAKLKDAIKNLSKYKDVFKDKVTLSEDFTLENPVGTVLTTGSVTYNDIITVKGKVQAGTGDQKKERAFWFTVKVDYTDQDKVKSAIARLGEMSNQTVQMSTDNLIVAKLKDAIKNLQNFKDIVKDGVTLKDDRLNFEKPANTALTTGSVAHNDVITVKGILKVGISEGNFTFTVTIDELTNQEKVNAAVAKFKSASSSIKTIELATANLTNPVEPIKKAIKNSETYKAVIKDGVILDGDLTLEKSANIPLTTGSVAHDDVITIKGKVKTETTVDPKEKEFTFDVRIDELIDQEKITEAIRLMNKLNNGIVSVATVDLASPVQSIKNEIKNFKEYVDAIKDVSLDEDLTFKKDDVAVTTVKDNDKITVNGTVKAGTAKGNFTFTVWVDELTNQKKVSKTVEQLEESMDDKIVSLATADLTVAKLEDAIKNLASYEESFEEGIILKNNQFIFKKDGVNVNTIANDDIITVEGTVKVEKTGIFSGWFSYDKEEKFSFTVKIKTT